MLHVIAMIGPGWLYHPLGVCVGHGAEYVHCRGYNFWSGIGSDLGELTLITGLLVTVWQTRKHLECHVEAPKNCHRIGRPVPGTGHRACRLHHPHAAEKNSGITQADIAQHHEDAAKTAFAQGRLSVEELEHAVERAIRMARDREDRGLT